MTTGPVAYIDKIVIIALIFLVILTTIGTAIFQSYYNNELSHDQIQLFKLTLFVLYLYFLFFVFLLKGAVKND